MLIFIKKVVLFMFQTMVDNVVSISLTGHRPDKLAGYDLSKPYYTRLRNRLIAIIERSLAKYDIVECHSGMALGADIVWAQAIVYCKEKYGSDKIKFVAEIYGCRREIPNLEIIYFGTSYDNEISFTRK